MRRAAPRQAVLRAQQRRRQLESSPESATSATSDDEPAHESPFRTLRRPSTPFRGGASHAHMAEEPYAPLSEWLDDVDDRAVETPEASPPPRRASTPADTTPLRARTAQRADQPDQPVRHAAASPAHPSASVDSEVDGEDDRRRQLTPPPGLGVPRLPSAASGAIGLPSSLPALQNSQFRRVRSRRNLHREA